MNQLSDSIIICNSNRSQNLELYGNCSSESQFTYNNESILELAGPANTINDQIKDISKSKNNEKLQYEHMQYKI